jgi:hypothetical protein
MLDIVLKSFGSTRGEIMEPMVKVLDRVGSMLKAEYGDAIPSARIRDEVERIRGHKPGAGCPSDLCYNICKDGMPFPNDPMFVQVSRGLYSYVGLGFAYTGSVTHTPKGKQPRQVGEWVNGSLRMF